MDKENIKLFICTPCHRNVSVNYCISMIELVQTLEVSQVNYEVDFVIGSSIVEDARNKCVSRFLQTDCTHLFFIDSDVSWDPEHIRDLFYSIAPDTPIIGGIYPKKKLNFNSILSAARDLRTMEDFTGTLDFSMFNPVGQLRNLVEVEHLPAGFMIVSRNVFEVHMKAFPDNHYVEEGFNMFRFFYCDLINKNGVKTSVGEDVNFCRISRELGYKSYFVPSCTIEHGGEIGFKNKFTQVKR